MDEIWFSTLLETILGDAEVHFAVAPIVCPKSFLLNEKVLLCGSTEVYTKSPGCQAQYFKPKKVPYTRIEP